MISGTNVDIWNHQNKHAPTPKGSRPYFGAPPLTCVQQRLVLWNKAKPMLLTYQEELQKQPLIRYLHGPYFLPYRMTMSTPDANNVARQNTIELIIISDAVYIGCRATTWQIPDSKLLPCSIYDILTQISNGFQWSLYRVQCKQSVSLLLFRRRFPLVFICHPSLSFCSRSANVHHVPRALSPRIMSRHAPYSWLATSLFWYWARFWFLKSFMHTAPLI